MSKKFTFLDNYLVIDYYENFLDENIANNLLDQLKNLEWPNKIKRHSKSYGNKGLIYNVDLPDYSNDRKRIKIARPVIPWEDFPTSNNSKNFNSLIYIKNKIEKLYNDNINSCVIQYYDNGKIHILPHRDREMLLDTSIYGLSLGATRKLTMLRYNQEPFYLPLEHNSLYILRPPTNTYWKHCIPKEPKIIESRFSLTFRNYRD